MRDATNEDTHEDHLEATRLLICKPTKEYWQGIDQHVEGLRNCRCLDSSHSKGTSSSLATLGWGTKAITSRRKLPVDEIANQGLNTIVRSTLGELDQAESIGDPWNRSWYATKGVSLFLGWLVDVRSDIKAVGISNDHRVLALKGEMGVGMSARESGLRIVDNVGRYIKSVIIAA